MIFVSILRWLRGYVLFSVQGGFRERFLNLCADRGVPLWEVRCEGGDLFAFTTIAGYKAMRECGKRSRSRLRMVEKSGLPFFLHKYRRRVGLLIGLLIFVCGIASLSQMIWRIDVVGNERIQEEIILDAFAARGVKLGVRRKSIDVNQTANAVKDDIEGISWIALNLRGSHAEIQLREIRNTEDFSALEGAEDAATNVVATKDGLLRRLEVYKGARQHAPGDAVLAGDLLAGGILEYEDGRRYFVSASAYAEAETAFSVKVQCANRFDGYTAVGAKTRYTLIFLWFRVPLGFGIKKDTQSVTLSSSNTFSAAGHKLPAALTRETVLTVQSKTHELSSAQMKLRSAGQLFDAGFSALRHTAVLSQKAAFTVWSSVCAVAWNGSTLENIALRQPLAQGVAYLND